MKSLIVASIVLLASPAFAKMAPPTPPVVNPHPPVTQQEKARTAAATVAIHQFLGGAGAVQSLDGAKARTRPLGPYLSKDVPCLKRQACWSQDARFVENVRGLRSLYGHVDEFRHVHVIPWSMKNFKNKRLKRAPAAGSGAHKKKAGRSMRARTVRKSPNLKADEYMVHSYARFKGNSGWYHLNVIMTEGEDGKPKVRYFFTTPMRNKMPPGVKC